MRISSWWLFAIPIVHCLHAQDAVRLDLKGAVHYALAQSPTLSSAMARKEIGALSLKSARTSLLPKIQMSASTGVNALLPASTNLWNNGLSLSLEQPILSNAVNGIAIDIADAKNSIADLDLVHQRELLSMKVAKDFYAHASAVQQQLINAQKQSALQKQLEVVNARFLQGIKRERDVLRFKAQVQQAQLQDANAKNRVTQTKNALIATIMGRNRQEQEVAFEFETRYPRMDVDAIPVREPLVANHTLYKKLELERRVAFLDVDLAKRQLWPELSGSLGATFGHQVGFQSFEITPSNAFMLSLSLRFELFDFGKRRRDIMISSKSRTIKEDSIQTELSKETLAVADMMAAFALIKDSLRLNKSLLKLEEDNFKKIESDYLQGKAQYLDVITALNSLSDAKSSLLTTLFDLETQLVTYRYYEGTLDDWLL